MHEDRDDIIAGALARLPREALPPSHLEEATVRRVRDAGLIRTRRRWAPGGFSVASWALAAGIAVMAFAGGSLYGTRRAMPPTQPTFALLLYGAGSGDDSAAHFQRAAEYSSWARANHATARVVGGEALGSPVASLAWYASDRGRSDSVIVDEEDHANPTEFVGYFLVTAPDREAAVQLARDCPHLRYGGRVVVRRVWPD